MFFPRGGSAQVVRYLAREIAGDGRFRPRVVAGRWAPPAGPATRAHFFAGLDLVAGDYDAALRAPDPHARLPALPPVLRGPPGRARPRLAVPRRRRVRRAPGRGVAADPGRRPGCSTTSRWPTSTTSPRCTRRSPRLRPDLPVITHLHGTELLMLDGHRGGGALAARRRVAPSGCAAGRRDRRACSSASEPARIEAAAALDLPADAVEVVPNGVDLGAVRRPPRHAGPSGSPPGAGGSATTRAAGRPPTRGPARSPTRRDSSRRCADPAAPVGAVRRPLHRGQADRPRSCAPTPARARARPPAAAGAVGRGPGRVGGRAPLRRRAPRRGGASEVFLAGWRGHDQLPEALAAADVLAVPSAGERFGLVYVEAMAMGVPADRGRRGRAALVHRRRPGLAGPRRLAGPARRRGRPGDGARRGGRATRASAS